MKTFIFDLDNTLYPESLNVFSLIDRRINRYMNQRLGIPEYQVDSLRRRYWEIYGVTLTGLMAHYDADPEDFLRYVHDVDLSNVLKPDPGLRNALKAISSPKVILTNGSRCHAQNVLSALGLCGIFDEIFDVRVASFKPKPFLEPYLKVLEAINARGTDCVMVDDIPENLRTAKELGMKTVLVGGAGREDYIDYCLEKVCAIGTLAEPGI